MQLSNAQKKFIVLNAYIDKKENSQNYYIRVHFKKLEEKKSKIIPNQVEGHSYS